MRPRSILLSTIALGLLMSALPATASAQNLPPPTGPVTFCGTQATPLPTSNTASVDGAAPTAVTFDATTNTACPAAATSSFQLAGALFPIGVHQVVVRSINAFGATVGAQYAVTVGVAPGAYTILGVVPPPGQ